MAIKVGSTFTAAGVWVRRLAPVPAAMLVLALIGCGGGGGGGGSSSGPVTVTGMVERVETSQAPSPAATVTIGSVSAATDTNGNFALAGVPQNATSLTVTASGSVTRTIPIALTAGTDNLGIVYISDTGYTATATGTVLVDGTDQAVGGATVTIASLTATTTTNGSFTIASLPVGLGNVPGAVIGTVTAKGFAVKQIVPSFAFVTGSNALGTIPIGSSVSSTTPPPPYTITGMVTVSGAAKAGVSVKLSQGAVVLGTTTTDSTGAYYFWVVPGAYLVTATYNTSTLGSDITLSQINAPITVPTLNL
jgi:hypothetical protein